MASRWRIRRSTSAATVPEAEPLGRHFSVTRALPRVLAVLADLHLGATFFVEGLNTELYPDALREIAAAGHEVAYHGWRHERSADLDAALERELLEHGVAALDALGLRPVRFRPPGGRLLPSSLPALRISASRIIARLPGVERECAAAWRCCPSSGR